jgi:hypothetical protein
VTTAPKPLLRWGIGVALVSIASLLALTGCSPAVSEAAPAASEAPAEPAPAETEAPATPASSATLDISCDDLLSDDAVMSFDSELIADTDYTPATGSYAAEIVSYGGVACGWTDSADGTTLTVAVAQPSADDLTTAETAMGGGAGTATDAFGSDLQAYTVNGGGTFTGDIEVFTSDGYWLSTVSPKYTSPQAAEPIVSFVLQALPSS